MSETASLLAEHRQEEQRLTTIDGNPWKYTGVYRCKCGQEYPSLPIVGGAFAAHRAHVAAILDAHFAERERALVGRVEGVADWYDAQPNWKPWHIGASIRAALTTAAQPTEGES